MEHNHCMECDGMIQVPFSYCRDDCSCLKNDLANMAHQIVEIPGVLEPPGVCGLCGYPSANRSFYRYRVLTCTDNECASNDQERYPGGNIYFQAILTGRREEEPLRSCHNCKMPLHLQEILDDYTSREERFKQDAAGKPYIIGVP